MAGGDRRGTVRNVQVLFEAGAIGGLADGALLSRFASRRDGGSEAAFAVLVERHGPMVLRVCRSILADAHEADDAFQATFLVLAQKAGSLRARETIGPWLHQVAFRVASCARSAAARRRKHEARAAALRGDVAREAAPTDDLGPILHAELAALPERYRAAVVLCCLEGRTHAEAARQLGCPVGTVESRLARGRDRLRDRLSRRGISPSAVLFGVSTDAVLPEALLNSTVRIASLLVAGRSGAIGATSAGAALLWKQVSGDMLMTRIQLALVALVATLAVPAVALTLRPNDVEKAPEAEKREEPKPVEIETLPSRVDFGTLHVGGQAEGTARLILDEDDEWGPLDVKVSPPHFVKIEDLRVRLQSRGRQKIRVVDLGLAVDTSRRGDYSGHVRVEYGDHRIEVPVSASVLPADDRLTKILVLSSSFGTASSALEYYRPWFDLIQSMKLDVSYRDPSRSLLHDPLETGLDRDGLPVVPDWLMRYDVVLVVDEGAVFIRGNDPSLLQSYVRGGGRLVVGASFSMHGSVPNANDLLRPFGIEMTDEVVIRGAPKERNGLASFAVKGVPGDDDAIMKGVKSVIFRLATPMRVAAGGRGKILLPDPEDGTRGFAAIARDGGEVIVLGSALFFGWLGEKDQGADNAALARNILTKPRSR